MKVQKRNALTGRAFGIVVLGGYGYFGRSIVKRLARIAGLNVWVAGRDLGRAEAVAEAFGAQALQVDIDQPDLAQCLGRVGADLVISTVGPFQHTGYRVAHAALDAGMHYIDLADGREHVCGITALDERARSLGRLVCSGASSVPALSSAVVDHLLPRFSRLDAIHHGISASARAPGRATLASVLSYCGKPVPSLEASHPHPRHGLQGPVRHVFATPVGARWLLDCDVPDLALFPDRYRDVASVRFSGGLGLGLYQLGGWLLSWPARTGLLPDGTPLAAAMHAVTRHLEFFSDGCSGMFVKLSGLDTDARPTTLCWELLADQEDGQQVPCIAAAALARKLADRTLHTRGAMPCIGLLELDDVLDELADLSVRVQLREDPALRSPGKRSPGSP